MLTATSHMPIPSDYWATAHEKLQPFSNWMINSQMPSLRWVAINPDPEPTQCVRPFETMKIGNLPSQWNGMHMIRNVKHSALKNISFRIDIVLPPTVRHINLGKYFEKLFYTWCLWPKTPAVVELSSQTPRDPMRQLHPSDVPLPLQHPIFLPVVSITTNTSRSSKAKYNLYSTSFSWFTFSLLALWMNEPRSL